MDGLTRTDDLVFVLAATNLPWELDAAMLRRLEKRVSFFIGKCIDIFDRMQGLFLSSWEITSFRNSPGNNFWKSKMIIMLYNLENYKQTAYIRSLRSAPFGTPIRAVLMIHPR